MTDQERQELDSLRLREKETNRTLGLIKARIAELEGKPATARFERMIAGQEPYTHEAYIALRAEEYGRRGGHYVYETAEDRALIEARLGIAAPCSGGAHCVPVPGGIPATVDCQCGAHRIEVHDCEYSGRPVVPHEHDLGEPAAYEVAHAVNGG